MPFQFCSGLGADTTEQNNAFPLLTGTFRFNISPPLLDSESVMNVLTQFEKDESAEDPHRPHCQKCNVGMWLVGREKRLTRKGTEQRTYVCEVCGLTQGVTV